MLSAPEEVESCANRILQAVGCAETSIAHSVEAGHLPAKPCGLHAQWGYKSSQL